MTTTSKRLGYGGSAEIDGIQVLITSGNFDETLSISYLEPLSIPPTLGASRSKITHADGTASYSGTIAFDVTANALSFITLSRLLNRYYTFDVGINDGENFFTMFDCKLTSLSLSGAPGGLITGSISVAATTKQTVASVDNAYILETDPPLGYWWSGNASVRDWTFSMEQAVTPMYLNQNVITPRYLKVGLISYSLSVTTYTPVATSVINISTSTFSLIGNTVSNGYTFGGVTELGMFSHAFDTAAIAASGSSGTIIS